MTLQQEALLDIVAELEQHARIRLAKAATKKPRDRRARLQRKYGKAIGLAWRGYVSGFVERNFVQKHGDHDQSTHGNWATGGGASHGYPGPMTGRQVERSLRESITAAGGDAPNVIIQVDGIDPILGAKFATDFSDLAREMPASVASLGTILLGDSMPGFAGVGREGWVAAVNGVSLMLNPLYYKDPAMMAAFFEDTRESGWLADPSERGAVGHEMAHALMTVNPRAYHEWAGKMSPADLGDHPEPDYFPSGYAYASAQMGWEHEAFAEAVAEARSPKPDADLSVMGAFTRGWLGKVSKAAEWASLDIDWRIEERELGRALEPTLRDLITEGYRGSRDDVARVVTPTSPDPRYPYRPALTLDERQVERIRRELANRIVQVNRANREMVRRYIERSLHDGDDQRQMQRGLRDEVQSWAGSWDGREKAIALTESANAYNLGSLLGYRESGIVDEVIIFDGEGTEKDPEWCGWTSHDDEDKASGSTRTLEDANEYPTAHPNCQRSWAPVVIPPDPLGPEWAAPEPEGETEWEVLKEFDESQHPRDEAGRFASVGASSEQEYRGQHHPNASYGAPGYDLTRIVGADIYEHPEWYGGEQWHEAVSQIRAMRGDPDHEATIYRAVPTQGRPFAEHPEDPHAINPGDWVTLDHAYAMEHGESNLTVYDDNEKPLKGEGYNQSFRILVGHVRAKDIMWPGDYLPEWGYFPQEGALPGRMVTVAKWDEADHPRDEYGRFAPAGGGEGGGADGGPWDINTATTALKHLGVARVFLYSFSPASSKALATRMQALGTEFPTAMRDIYAVSGFPPSRGPGTVDPMGDVFALGSRKTSEGWTEGVPFVDEKTAAATISVSGAYGHSLMPGGLEGITDPYHPGTTVIEFNADLFGDDEKMDAYLSDTTRVGYFVDPTPEGIINHEFGHAYKFALEKTEEGPDTLDRFYNAIARNSAPEDLPSGYARKATLTGNTDEVFGEAFAEAVSQKPDDQMSNLGLSFRGILSSPDILKFDPDQPRDEGGRWTDGGGGGGGDAAGPSQHTPTGPPAPLHVTDLSEPRPAEYMNAVEATFQDRFGIWVNFGHTVEPMLTVAEPLQRTVLDTVAALDRDGLLPKGVERIVYSIPGSDGEIGSGRWAEYAPNVFGDEGASIRLNVERWNDTEHLREELALAEKVGHLADGTPEGTLNHEMAHAQYSVAFTGLMLDRLGIEQSYSLLDAHLHPSDASFREQERSPGGMLNPREWEPMLPADREYRGAPSGYAYWNPGEFWAESFAEARTSRPTEELSAAGRMTREYLADPRATVERLKEEAKVLAEQVGKHGDHDQSTHGNRYGGGGGESMWEPTRVHNYRVENEMEALIRPSRGEWNEANEGVDLGMMPTKVADELHDGLVALNKRFPTYTIASIGLSESDLGAEAMTVQVSPGSAVDSHILFDVNLYEDPEAMAQERAHDREVHWSIDPTAKGTLNHEFAHVMANADAGLGRKWGEMMNAAAAEAPDRGLGGPESMYAYSEMQKGNHAEVWAECFSEALLDKPDDEISPMGRLTREFIKDYEVKKHGDHDQSEHGNWARGGSEGGTEVGVSRARPELGTYKTYADVVAARSNSVIAEAERTTTSDLEHLGIKVDEQRQVAGYYEGGGEPSLMLELGPGHTKDDIDLTGAYMVRRNEQDSVITNTTGRDMARLGLEPNGDVFRVSGLPTDPESRAAFFTKVHEVTDFGSYDEENGVIEVSVFDADQAGLEEALTRFALAEGAEIAIIPTHTRWYFHDEELRTGASEWLHPADPSVLLTADDVRAAQPERGGVIGPHRVEKAGGGHHGRAGEGGHRGGPPQGPRGPGWYDGAGALSPQVAKHGDHDQSSHGNWATGGGDGKEPLDALASRMHERVVEREAGATEVGARLREAIGSTGVYAPDVEINLSAVGQEPMDADLGARFADAFTRFAGDMPETVASIGTITMDTRTGDLIGGTGGWVAAYRDHTLALNPTYFTDPKALSAVFEKSAEYGWWADSTIEGAVNHELSHAFQEMNDDDYFRWTQEADILSESRMTDPDFWPSGYAHASAIDGFEHEAFAEAFAEARTAKPDGELSGMGVLTREWLDTVVRKHGDHDQSTHGSWATGAGAGGADPSAPATGNVPVGTVIAGPKVPMKPSVPADALPVGFGRNSDGMGSNVIYGNMPETLAIEEKYGQGVRGDEVISPYDPRVPDTVYHVTSNLPAVVEAGYLRAGGKGGLGGDETDRIVSMTIDHDIATQLAEDMRLMGIVGNTPREEVMPLLDEVAEAEGWKDQWVKSTTYSLGATSEYAGRRYGAETQAQYSQTEWGNMFFSSREHVTGARQPLFFGDSSGIDPLSVGVVAIPKSNLDNGALLVDFDLRSTTYGLQEIRSYGDVPLERAVVTKWDESEHPRDEAGRFTSGGGFTGFGYEGRWGSGRATIFDQPLTPPPLVKTPDLGEVKAGTSLAGSDGQRALDAILLEPYEKPIPLGGAPPASSELKHDVMVSLGAVLEREFSEATLDRSLWGAAVRNIYDEDSSLTLQGGASKAEDVASAVVHGWTHLTETMHEETTLIQAAVQDVFGVESPHLDERLRDENHWRPGDAGYDEMGLRLHAWTHYSQEDMDVTKAAVREMYDQTQSMLREAGIDEVTVYRGVDRSIGDGDTVGETRVEQNPASSWSLSEDTARDFAGLNEMNPSSEVAGSVLVATFPRERILSTPKTGIGCLEEGEVVVIGGTAEVSVRRWEDYESEGQDWGIEPLTEDIFGENEPDAEYLAQLNAG